ncbi:MAG: hypothetical protein IPM52_14500 [Bacteroidetes bacterium]|nr:hypothetical protein [Bacteroidota bacterium]
MTRQALLIVALVAAAVAGTRYLWPRVEYRQTVVERETIKKDVRTIIKHVERKDGSKETVTTIVDNSKESSNRTETIVKAAQAQWLLSPLLKIDAKQGLTEPVYGLMVQRRVLGPGWLGVAATTDKQIMATIGLEF